MESFLLRILDLFQGLYRLAGVDYKQLRAIVAIKLMMDNRRQVVAYRRKEKKEPGKTFLTTLLIYGLFGIFMAFMLNVIPSFMLSMIMFFSYIMVMIAMTLITDFSSILLDTSDNTIVLPRPVDSRTLFVARTTHILLYLAQLTVGLSLASLVVVILKYGFAFALFFTAGIILSVTTAIFLTNGMYLLIMQFSSEEKLKNVINYFQIIMAVVIIGGYQIVPRLVNRLAMESYVFEMRGWSYFIPSIWVAGALEAIHENTFDVPHLILIALVIIVPVSGVYLVNQYLTPVFSQKIGSMGSTSEGSQNKPAARRGNWYASLLTKMTATGVERGTFEIIYKILGRDRKIKLKIYPAFGYIVVFGIVFMIDKKQDIITTFHNLPDTQYHLMLIYLTFMILQVAYYEIPYSDDFKASWIYFATPLKHPGEILSGTVKAIFARLFLPGYAVISVFVLAVWKIQAIDDLLFGLFNNFLMLLIIAMVGKHHLPFSMSPSVKNQSGNFARGLIMVMLIGGLGFTHYLLARFEFILLAALPFQLVAIYLLHKFYKKTSWSELTL